MPKTIQLTIPDAGNVPEIIATFSPEEVFLMLKIGSDCLKEGRNALAGMSQVEIYNKIKDESKEEVKKLEIDLIIQREMTLQMEEKIRTMYTGQVEQIKRQLDMTREQLKNYEADNRGVIQKEVDRIREKYDLLLEEKDKKLDRMNENYEKMLIQSHKSTSHKGSDGERTFSEYAETFMDFKGFDIIDKHTQGGEGDFHLHFEDFDVLADAKNYKKKVPMDQREKIKKEHSCISLLI